MTIYDTSRWLHWDPSPAFFTIPGIDWPVTWYGMFFALGFVVGYLFVLTILRDKEEYCSSAEKLCDSLLWYIIIGTIVGARLGHLLFYDPSLLLQDPLVFFKTWEGGLASHGGAVGVITALALFRWRSKKTSPRLTLLSLFDILVIPTAFVGSCIRIGNFFNQEVLGSVTQVPWAIVFGHPFDGSSPLPRHPAQLYEACFYSMTCLFLWHMYKKGAWKIGSGRFFGWFLSLVFGFRFFIEFFKDAQSELLGSEAYMLMGHYLSIPFVAVGIFFIIKAWKRGSSPKECN
jgi:phosphatidylglycerol---prolipoprotein diacylglyceryl transferase